MAWVDVPLSPCRLNSVTAAVRMAAMMRSRPGRARDSGPSGAGISWAAFAAVGTGRVAADSAFMARVAAVRAVDGNPSRMAVCHAGMSAQGMRAWFMYLPRRFE
jgi:hypothetical protein